MVTRKQNSRFSRLTSVEFLCSLAGVALVLGGLFCFIIEHDALKGFVTIVAACVLMALARGYKGITLTWGKFKIVFKR